MVATLLTRKEALEAKISDKTAELKRLCLQEADLTGELPPETPLEPGEPLPTIRRRVGTSFSFPQSLINNSNGTDDASLGGLELECQVQTNIAEAVLAMANDVTAGKSVRRKHRLRYRQIQRHLMELETRLTLLKQGKHQPLKPQQIKKKPRPNTTTVDHVQLMREFNGQKVNGYYNGGSWPIKSGPDVYGDEDIRQFSSLHRPPRSSGTSQSSNSPRLSARDLSAFNSSGLPDQYTMTSSLSQPNIQDLRPLVTPDVTVRELKRSERRGSGRQWDSQSAGGTLLPNQTYPESHQPNLNRTQSLGSVDGQRQTKEKEKEWYETSLDSAPSPPLRTSSRLPTSARMLYHMQEMQIRDAVNRTMAPPRMHPSLTRTHRATPVDEVVAGVQGMRLAGSAEPVQDTRKVQHQRHMEGYPPRQLDPRLHIEHPRQPSIHSLSEHTRYGETQQAPVADHPHRAEPRPVSERPRHLDIRPSSEYPRPELEHTRQPIENPRASEYARPEREHTRQPIETPRASEYARLVEHRPSAESLRHVEPPRSAEPRQGTEYPRHMENRPPSELLRHLENRPPSEPPRHVEHRPPLGPRQSSDAVYIDIPDDEVDSVQAWRPSDGAKTPTQPYYHSGAGWAPSVLGLPEVHPPHAITQEEITFDTVVPFESPQNHTVVQAGIWQPYREVTKPFEMSDFYKYSTKFRQARASPAQPTPEPARKSPGHAPVQPAQSPNTLVGVYQPLRPMTCQPLERRGGPAPIYSDPPPPNVPAPKII